MSGKRVYRWGRQRSELYCSTIRYLVAAVASARFAYRSMSWTKQACQNQSDGSSVSVTAVVRSKLR